MKGRYNMEHIILIATFCMCGYLINDVIRLHKRVDAAVKGLIDGIGNNDRVIYEKLNDIERSIHDEKNFT